MRSLQPRRQNFSTGFEFTGDQPARMTKLGKPDGPKAYVIFRPLPLVSPAITGIRRDG